MAKTLQFRRGTTTELSTIAGAVGELFVDTTKDTVVVMDGSTAGGFPLAKESDLAAKANSSDVTTALAGKANTSDVNAALAGKASTSDLTTGLADKQATLVSGTNIKTVNGTSILGSGNITISGGGGGDLTQVSSDITPLFDAVYDIGSTTNRFYDAYLGNKLDINEATLVGSNAIAIPAQPAIPESTVTTTVNTPTTFQAAFTNGEAYVNGNQATLYSSNSGDAWNTWAAANWNTQKLIGATIVFFSLANSYSSFTITGFVGSGPYYGFQLDTSYPGGFDSHIVEATITYNNTSTVTTVIPAQPAQPPVYEYTLASNAIIVAPTLVSDDAMIGTNYFELDTITPAHILGDYSDLKGTLVVDGNLTVKDALNVRSNVTLKQDYVTLGKVLEKSVIPSTDTQIVASSQLGNVISSINLNYGQFYSSYAYLYTYSGNFSPTFLTNIGVGKSFRIARSYQSTYDLWWDITVQSLSNYGSYVYMQYTVTGRSPNASTYGYTYPDNYSSYLDYNSIQFTYTNTEPTKYKVEFDASAVAIPLSSSVKKNGVALIAEQANQFNNSVVSDRSYISTSSWDWLSINDAITYAPTTSSIVFKNLDGSSTKAITYDNLTNTITYEGIPSPIIKLASNGNIISTNAYGVGNPSDGNSVESSGNGPNGIAIGLNTTIQASSIAIGNNAQAAGSGIAIGYNAKTAYQGVSVASNPNNNSHKDYAIAIGYNTTGLSHKAIALGYGCDSYVYSANTYYTLPNLQSTHNTRNVVFNIATSTANPYLYVSYPGEYVSNSSTAQSFNISELLNFNTSNALITLEFLVATNSTSDYWSSGVKRYMFNNNLSTNKLVELTAPIATQYGTATYANNLSVDLLNNSSQQQLKVASNASDSTYKLITIKMSVSLYV